MLFHRLPPLERGVRGDLKEFSVLLLFLNQIPSGLDLLGETFYLSAYGDISLLYISIQGSVWYKA